MATQVYFRLPRGAKKGRGNHTVGVTTDAQPYYTEACIDPDFGPDFCICGGRGDTPAEARSEAARKVLAAEESYARTAGR